ncbi:hypothetical protein J7D36_11785 [Acinetobacter baumannii]|uniref:hypothetical protein n=1 Tax=Acinetobacter baumannii TaxID=470 RepID=UPI001BA7316F|nr:hypothetical protein [Acinetobacter baumannii]QUD77787.1 hypothetical protein J7D36_11785 [Acinetobacter baumannii]
MLVNNQTIFYSGDEMVEVLKEIEYILVSLHKVGSHYAETLPDSYIEYADKTTKFIDDNNICERLARIRRILSSKFDNGLGEDDMDDLERAFESLEYWKPKKKQNLSSKIK